MDICCRAFDGVWHGVKIDCFGYGPALREVVNQMPATKRAIDIANASIGDRVPALC
jgi:hypothetical protein